MKLNQYFKAEKYKYWFYCLLPVIFALELLFFLLSTALSPDNMTFILCLCVICILTALILAVIQQCSAKKYNKQLSELSEYQISEAEKTASLCKMGNWMITEEIIIYYGMFLKKVILIEDVADTALLDGEIQLHRMKVKSNHIEIIFKSGRKIQIKGPALYKGNESEALFNMINAGLNKRCVSKDDTAIFKNYKMNPPFNGILACIMLGVILVLLIIKDTVKYSFFSYDDGIKSLLLNVGYDSLFNMAAVLIFTAFFIIMLVIKQKITVNDKSDFISKRVFGAVIVLCCFFTFASLFLLDDNESLARADYKAYINKEYTEKMTELNKKGGYDIGWIKDLNAKKTIEKYNMNVICLTDGKEQYFLINKDISIKQNKKYKIRYLDKTHIITEIE